jgi:hypothetical protein
MSYATLLFTSAHIGNSKLSSDLHLLNKMNKINTSYNSHFICKYTKYSSIPSMNLFLCFRIVTPILFMVLLCKTTPIQLLPDYLNYIVDSCHLMPYEILPTSYAVIQTFFDIFHKSIFIFSKMSHPQH